MKFTSFIHFAEKTFCNKNVTNGTMPLSLNLQNIVKTF